MSFAQPARLLARPFLQNAARPSTTIARCSPALLPILRPFSQTAAQRDDGADAPKKGGQNLLAAMYGSSSNTRKPAGPARTAAGSSEASQNLFMGTINQASRGRSSSSDGGLDLGLSLGLGGGSGTSSLEDIHIKQDDLLEPYHMHVLSHKHNTHVTVTKPNRDAIISLSTGNIGFRKSRRKSYDAAYQLTAYVFEKLTYAGWHDKIKNLELMLRGFGAGRDAAVKVLMAPEGKIWRSKIRRVGDSTRLKFGGTRSKKPRRV